MVAVRYLVTENLTDRLRAARCSRCPAPQGRSVEQLRQSPPLRAGRASRGEPVRGREPILLPQGPILLEGLRTCGFAAPTSSGKARPTSSDRSAAAQRPAAAGRVPRPRWTRSRSFWVRSRRCWTRSRVAARVPPALPGRLTSLKVHWEPAWMDGLALDGLARFESHVAHAVDPLAPPDRSARRNEGDGPALALH